MSDEEVRELVDTISKEEFPYALAIAKAYEKLEQENEELEEQQQEFVKYLENELDRLARAVSEIYEDSLGKTRFVNEDIFNEVNNILSKYKEIIGDTEND